MMCALKVAVLGATGSVGRVMVSQLHKQTDVLLDRIWCVASARSVGTTLVVDGHSHVVVALESFDFTQVQFVLCALSADLAKKVVPLALAAGCYVIDNSAAFRLDPKVPLIIPEVNGTLLASLSTRLVASPNCCVTQLLLAVAPIANSLGVDWIQVATYQALSGAGMVAMQQLSQQSQHYLADDQLHAAQQTGGQKSQAPQDDVVPYAFNVVPKIDRLLEDGFTGEEDKIIRESRKIMAQPTLAINPTCVRVPVFHGHGIAVHMRCEAVIDRQTLLTMLQKAPGLHVAMEDIPTPRTHGQHTNQVTLGRLRHAVYDPKVLNFWLIGNNLYKGAASNAVQIMALLAYYHVLEQPSRC
jgi:aspartate-semialdehyde dehydrogenase